MERAEKQLKKLPRKKLGLLATARIFYLLTEKLWNKRENTVKAGVFQYLRPVAIGASLSFLLLVVIPGYAYASKKVTYGDWLYPVKIGIEKIELSLANTPEEETEKKEKFIERRLEEAEVISKEKEDKANGPLIATINEVTKLQNEVKKEKNENTEIKDRERKVAALAGIAGRVGIKASEGVVDSVAEALETIKFPPGQEKRNNPGRPEPGVGRFPEASNTPEVIGSEVEEKSGDEDIDLKIPERKPQPEELRRSYEDLREAVSAIEKNLREDEYEENDIDELSVKLEKKLEKAEEAIMEENLGAAEGLMKATEALTNNAKHFINTKSRNNNSNKSKNSNSKNKTDEDSSIDENEQEEEAIRSDDNPAVNPDQLEEENNNNWLKYKFNWKKK